MFIDIFIQCTANLCIFRDLLRNSRILVQIWINRPNQRKYSLFYLLQNIIHVASRLFGRQLCFPVKLLFHRLGRIFRIEQNQNAQKNQHDQK